MRIIGWALVTVGFLWTMHTARHRTDAYDEVISQNRTFIQKNTSFTQDDLNVAFNAVTRDVLRTADAQWTMTPAWLLLAGAICLSGCLRKENYPKLRRIARVLIWIIVGLIPVIVALAIWGQHFHGIFPLTPSQRRALRASVQNTRRIEIHRYGDSRATLVITNAAEIERFGEVMTPRWQSLSCLCMGMTMTRFIDGEGRTNTANITDEYIKFAGPWAEKVVFRMYQAVPPPSLLELMAEYDRVLDKNAQPPPADDSQPARRGSRTPEE